MVQRREHSGFTLKAGKTFRIIDEISGEDFDGHVAREFRVARAIHLAHAARANLRDDFVGAETRARGDAHFFSPAVQLRTTVIGADAACSGTVLIRNRWPSADTAY